MDDRIISKMISFQENEFTIKILIPLFKSMNYDKVEFFGGVDENGKDFICWKKNDFDDYELTLVQVKKVKPTKSASSKDSIMEINIQLSQCLSKKLPDTDGIEYSPVKIIFITPCKIDTKTLLKEIEEIKRLREYGRIKIIDGTILIKMIKKFNPQLMQVIMGDKYSISNAISKNLTNKELMSALQIDDNKDISNFFLDLLFVTSNKNNSRLLFSNPKCVNKKFSLDKNEWIKVKKYLNKAYKNYNINILSKHTSEVEEEYNNLIMENNIIKNRIIQIEKNENTLKSEEKELRSIIQKIETSNKEIVILEKRKKELNGESIIEISESINNILEKIVPRELNKINEIGKKRTALKENMQILRDKILKEKYHFEIKGDKVIEIIEFLKNKIIYNIKEINNSKNNLKIIKQSIVNIKKLHLELDYICSNDYVMETIIMNNIKIKEHKDFTIKIPVHNFFKTKENMILVGDAGAGKTTTLQMYAKENLDNDNFVLYVQLPKLVNKWIDFNDALKNKTTPSLISGLYYYINSLKESFKLDKEDLSQLIKDNRITLLLDGLDEISKSHPFIIKTIQQFNNEFKDIQLIITCRISSDIYKKLPFMTFKLLPFTDEQRNEFFTRWFREENDKNANAIKEHLLHNKELSKLVRNPLLATILCTLQKFKIPLPNTEITLYSERFRLLIGDYDIHKEVKRVESYKEHLNKAMRKIAYNMHLNNKRYLQKSRIKNIVFEELKKDGISFAEAKKITDELINPCNILESMTENGEFGFGHLRFQEYQVACEFTKNRSIDIIPYLMSNWWQGAIVLFSQMENHIDWIIEKIQTEKIQFLEIKDVLFEMIKYHPEKEKEDIVDIINKNIKYEVLESDIL